MKFTTPDIGTIRWDPRDIVGFLPAITDGKPIIGQVVVFVKGGHKLVVKGNMDDTPKDVQAAVELLDQQGGLKRVFGNGGGA
jgi:hypothetical protein